MPEGGAGVVRGGSLWSSYRATAAGKAGVTGIASWNRTTPSAKGVGDAARVTLLPALLRTAPRPAEP